MKFLTLPPTPRKATLTAAYNPDQERDAGGKWTSGGGDDGKTKTGKVNISEIKPNANLERADLIGANLTGASLSGANLSDAYLRSANLTDADLSNANLISADLWGANLKEADLTNADLTSARLIGTLLTDANLTDANLRSADLIGADLRAADLTGANFANANLRDADLYAAKLSDTDFTDAKLSGANFTEADLTSAKLSGAEIANANLSYADLNGADLNGINFLGTNLSGANCTDANLTAANLDLANLSGTIFTNADLTGANLNRTDLFGTNFDGANLKDTTFRRTDLSEVDFSKAINNPMEKAEKENADRLEAAKGSAEFSTQAIQSIGAEALSKDELVALSEDWVEPEFYQTIDNLKGVGRFFEGADPVGLKEDVEKQIENSAYFGFGTGNGLAKDADSLATAREYTDAWQSSANNSCESEMIQESASRVLFNQEVIKPEGWVDFYRAQSDQAELVVFEMYQRTQKEFANAGYKPDDTITLYRGVKEDSLDLSPMSSWSLSSQVANAFASQGSAVPAGTVFGAEVPIANIVSLPTTGVGCLDEFEVVVLNKPAET